MTDTTGAPIEPTRLYAKVWRDGLGLGWMPLTYTRGQPVVAAPTPKGRRKQFDYWQRAVINRRYRFVPRGHLVYPNEVEVTVGSELL